MHLTYWIIKTTNTHSEYVTHCFSTATLVARTRLNISSTCLLNIVFKFLLDQLTSLLLATNYCDLSPLVHSDGEFCISGL